MRVSEEADAVAVAVTVASGEAIEKVVKREGE